MRTEYKLVGVNRVCPGIHEVRVGPATRSAVATCKVKKMWEGESPYSDPESPIISV